MAFGTRTEILDSLHIQGVGGFSVPEALVIPPRLYLVIGEFLDELSLLALLCPDYMTESMRPEERLTWLLSKFVRGNEMPVDCVLTESDS